MGLRVWLAVGVANVLRKVNTSLSKVLHKNTKISSITICILSGQYFAHFVRNCHIYIFINILGSYCLYCIPFVADKTHGNFKPFKLRQKKKKHPFLREVVFL